jgi:hypothetical protein
MTLRTSGNPGTDCTRGLYGYSSVDANSGWRATFLHSLVAFSGRSTIDSYTEAQERGDAVDPGDFR